MNVNAASRKTQTIKNLVDWATNDGSSLDAAKPWQQGTFRDYNIGPRKWYCIVHSVQNIVKATVVRFLTIEACDKIQVCLELLIKDRIIQWQGSLKKTYDKYIHPDVIDYNSKEMWEDADNGRVYNLFQMDTDVGSEAIKKVRPTSLKELALTNSVMRLMGNDRMVPIDHFVHMKNSEQARLQELENARLTEDEKATVDAVLHENYLCSIEQEDLMRLCMNNAIAGFTMVEANKIRKAVAKKKPALVAECKELFYKKGAELGTRKEFLDYVWEYDITPQLGYSFSANHTLPYSCIALQEMNLFHKYGSIYWQCACLTVNASAIEDDEDGGNVDYAKTAKAISNMQHQGVNIALPVINQAAFGFSPDAKNNRIIFGLKAISGVGDDQAKEITIHRPYVSMVDFCERLQPAKIAMISLIKAGAFDELEQKPRQEIMKNYLLWQAQQDNPPKTTLNMRNFDAVMRLNILPKQFDFESRVFGFRAYIKQSPWGKDKYLLDQTAQIFFDNELFKFFNEDEHYIVEGGNTFILAKPFEKWFKQITAPITEWIKAPETLTLFNKAVIVQYCNDLWEKYCSGTVPHWEMESLSFYYTAHELADVNYGEYNLNHWNDIPTEPVVVSTQERKNKKTGEVTTYEKYQLYRICGTVLAKNKTKHSITLLTPDDVVTVKYYDGAFAHYDKQISRLTQTKKETLEKSWFSRGTLLLLTGIRRGDTFFPKTYRDSIYQHSTCRICAVNGSMLDIQNERVNVDD